MITRFKIFESKDIEIKDILDELRQSERSEYSLTSAKYPPEYVPNEGWVTVFKVSRDMKTKKQKQIVEAIREYIRWVYNFDEEDDIMVNFIYLQPLYDDLGVYNKAKKMMSVGFNTKKFSQSNHTFRKGELEDFIEFMKDPDFFREQRKYNL